MIIWRVRKKVKRITKIKAEWGSLRSSIHSEKSQGMLRLTKNINNTYAVFTFDS